MTLRDHSQSCEHEPDGAWFRLLEGGVPEWECRLNHCPGGREVTVSEIQFVTDGPPGPNSGRFVEVEDAQTGESIKWGKWLEGTDGMWTLIGDTIVDVAAGHP